MKFMMFKKLITFCLLLISYANLAQNNYQGEQEKVHDLVHTKLKVDFNFSQKTMNGEAWITAKPHFYNSNTIILDANAMIIHEVNMNNIKLEYNYNEYDLIINLPKTYQKNEEFTGAQILFFKYSKYFTCSSP